MEIFVDIVMMPTIQDKCTAEAVAGVADMVVIVAVTEVVVMEVVVMVEVTTVVADMAVVVMAAVTTVVAVTGINDKKRS
jgi:hypothetical protein